MRDFVYLDVARLHSLYSQVFEGVAEQIVQHTLDQSVRRRSDNDGLQDAQLETQIAEASLKTESSILHDHMYNRLEEALSGAITIPEGVTPDTFANLLPGAFLIKVEGKAEIEDYKRIQHFTEKFNNIAEGIAYCAMSSNPAFVAMRDGLPLMIQATEAELRAKGKNHPERQQLNAQLSELKKLQNPDELTQALAKELGLHQDPKFLGYISEWFDTFYPNGFEITIVPMDEPKVVYRGVLDKQFLRLEPEYLRNLYSGYVDAKWVMVGQITYLPGTQVPPMESETLIGEEADSPSDSNTQSLPQAGRSDENVEEAIQRLKNAPTETSPMRDPFRTLFKAAAGLDKMFFESKFRVEVLVRPLAIYQETVLHTSQETN